MSSGNLTIINQLYEAFEKRNMPAFMSLLSPAINVVQCPEVPWGGSFDGFKGVEVFFGKVNVHLGNLCTSRKSTALLDKVVSG
jgi:hypothetical protein